MSFFSSLRNLSKSKTDCVLGGVCGGLGEHTPLPAWLWRAGFLFALLFLGTGGLLYIILWIALPEGKSPAPPPSPPPT